MVMAAPDDAAQSTALQESTIVAIQPADPAQVAVATPRYSGYRPLDTSKRELRLLDINEGLHCHLRHASLDDAPVYNALSYYLGPPGCNRTITVNGEVVQIRKTLYRFLKSLYRLYGSFCVWVDTLCIDQGKIPERNTQVAMMSDIYTQASCVYCWLGEGGPDMSYAMRYIQSGGLAEKVEHNMTAVEAGLEQILLQSYWTRVWIVQECLLNRNVLVVCDSLVVALNVLLYVVEALDLKAEGTNLNELERRYHPAGLPPKQPSEQPPMLVGRTKGMRTRKRMKPLGDGRVSVRKGQTKEWPLLALIHDFHDSACQDVRDRIYGFRALAVDGHRLHVDYSCSSVGVVFRLASVHNWSCFMEDVLVHNGLQPTATKWDWNFPLLDRAWSDGDEAFFPIPRYHRYHGILDMDSFRTLYDDLRPTTNDAIQAMIDEPNDWLVLEVRLCEYDRVIFEWLGFKIPGDQAGSQSSVYVSFFCPAIDRGVHVEVERISGTILNATVGRGANPRIDPDHPDLWVSFNHGFNRRLTMCRITQAVHISRFAMLALTYYKLLAPLSDEDQRHPPAPPPRCTCKLPDGLAWPPPPWGLLSNVAAVENPTGDDRPDGEVVGSKGGTGSDGASATVETQQQQQQQQQGNEQDQHPHSHQQNQQQHRQEAPDSSKKKPHAKTRTVRDRIFARLMGRKRPVSSAH